MPFVDLSEFLTENDLVIQNVGPRDYVVPAIDAETGLKYSALSAIAVRAQKGEKVRPEDLAALKLGDAEERAFVVEMLGQEVIDQMREDKVSWPAINRIAQYVFTHFAVSADAAAKAKVAGAFSGKAQAPTPNRAARRETVAKSARTASRGSRSPKTQG